MKEKEILRLGKVNQLKNSSFPKIDRFCFLIQIGKSTIKTRTFVSFIHFFKDFFTNLISCLKYKMLHFFFFNSEI